MNANAVHKHPPTQPSDNLNATGDPRWHHMSDLRWHPTTADEMKAFVGINIATGGQRLAGIPRLATFRQCMTGERTGRSATVKTCQSEAT